MKLKKQIAALAAVVVLFAAFNLSMYQLLTRRLSNNFSGATQAQALAVALAAAQTALGDDGAWRVHGGGFGGTILCFVPCERTTEFVRLMDGIFGKDSSRVLRIRPIGGAELGGDHVMSV